MEAMKGSRAEAGGDRGTTHTHIIEVSVGKYTESIEMRDFFISFMQKQLSFNITGGIRSLQEINEQHCLMAIWNLQDCCINVMRYLDFTGI